MTVAATVEFGRPRRHGRQRRSEGAAGEHVANRGHFGERQQRHEGRDNRDGRPFVQRDRQPFAGRQDRAPRPQGEGQQAREPRARSPYDERQPSDNSRLQPVPERRRRDGRSFAGGDRRQGPAGQGQGHGGKSHGHGGSQERRPREGGFAAWRRPPATATRAFATDRR